MLTTVELELELPIVMSTGGTCQSERRQGYMQEKKGQCRRLEEEGAMLRPCWRCCVWKRHNEDTMYSP